MELVVLANLLREPAVLAYHHKELAFRAKLLREPLVLTYHHRELAVLANLLREPVILANLLREVNFPISFGINMDYEKFMGKMAKAIKRSPIIQAVHHKGDLCLSQQGASNFDNPTQGAGSSSQRGSTEKSTGDRNTSVVRNLPIKVTSQRASSSGIALQGAGSSSKSVEGASSSGTPHGARNCSKNCSRNCRTQN
jgi:hypothetical protein